MEEEKVNIAPQIEESWKAALAGEFEAEYFRKLKETLLGEKMRYKIYPPGNRIFSAFNYTPFDKVKVVIIGQDPYHGEGQAHGLSFSVPDGVKPPPSLVNIFKELGSDLGISAVKSGNLESWARQGVLLLNAFLTVRANEPGSHSSIGWEIFTNRVISILSEKREKLVFILWGKFAQQKEELIDVRKHYVLKSAHPSPFSATKFFGCRHFSKTNEILTSNGIGPINWNIC